MKTVYVRGYCMECGERVPERKPHFGVKWWQGAIPYPCPNNGRKMVELISSEDSFPWKTLKREVIDECL